MKKYTAYLNGNWIDSDEIKIDHERANFIKTRESDSKKNSLNSENRSKKDEKDDGIHKKS